MARNNERLSASSAFVDTSQLPPPPVTKLAEAETYLNRKLSLAEREWLNFWTLSKNNFWLMSGNVKDLREQGSQYTIRAVLYRMTSPSRGGVRHRRMRHNDQETVETNEERWQWKIHMPAGGPGEVSKTSFPHFCLAMFDVKDLLLDSELLFLEAGTRDTGTQLRRRLRETRKKQTNSEPATPTQQSRRTRGLEF